MKLLIVKPNVRGAKLPVWKFANAVAATAPRFAGASLDSIAAKYSIGRDALWRHMAKHVSEDLKAQYIVDVPVKELAARASAEGLSVLDYLAIVRGVLLQEFQLAAGVHDKHATASLAGRLTEVLREVGRITGEIMRSPAVQNINNSINITNSPIFIDLQQMLIKRLAGHPQALAAVIEGLRELESRSAPRPIAGPLIEHQGEAHAVAYPSPYRQLAAALDPVAFAKEALGFDADEWQKALLRTTASQVILNNSRQSGKSTVTAIRALHKAIFAPGSLILLISPSLRQSKELFGKVTTYLKALQPVQVLEEDNRLSCTLENGSRICSLPGDPKTIRGFSAPALILEDEAAFVDDELFTAIKPMLAVSRGQLILMSTPFGRRGHFYDVWQSGGEAWHRISVPATACPRISPEFLTQERESMSEWRFRQEYMCEFVETVDQIFSYDVIRAAFDADVKPLFTPDEIIRMAGAA